MEFNTIFFGLAFGLGILLILSAAIFLILTCVGIILSLIFIKTNKVIIPRVTMFVLNLVEAPIRSLLWILGIEEDIVSKMMIDIRNNLYRNAYENTPYNKRAIFIPQCLRHPKCPAPLTAEGIKCLNCGRCGLGRIKEEAEQLDIKFFIAPGSSLIKRMVKKYKPRAVLGVGCSLEVKEGMEAITKFDLPVEGIMLYRDGCVDTRADIIRLMELIWCSKEKKKYSIEEDPIGMKKAIEISNLWEDDNPAKSEEEPSIVK